jgi:poly-beta-1,6-N-acetyl-D-glucosamine N-deacetylase
MRVGRNKFSFIAPRIGPCSPCYTEAMQNPGLPTVHPSARQNGIRHPVTLMVWHDIVPEDKLVWFDTTIAEFDRQLNQIAKAGAHPITLDALYSYLAKGSPVPSRGAVVLCFDDNTVGIHDSAAPRLKKRGWPFAVSAHTAYVGVRTGKEHNTYAMLQAMERMGATIVSQTHTHPPDLTRLSDAALQKEMVESKRRMEAGLGHPVRFLTYPAGKWNRRVAQAAQAAGYLLGLTEDRGAAEKSPHLLALNRYSTHRRYSEALQTIARSHKGNS